jgi:hypothetical protein
MPEDWAAQRVVPVEAEARSVSPAGDFSCLCELRVFCGAVVGR